MRRGSARVGGGLLALLLTVVTAGGALGQEGGSPAGEHAEVIAHGVVAMPAEELTWRLYDGSAGAADEAEPLTTEWPGFLLGGEDPTLVDVDGDRSVVSDGKATLVREGVDLTVSSLDGDETDYGWLTLTDAGLDEDDDALAFLGDPFDAPSDGEHQVDLVRDVLADDEETDIAAGVAPTVLIVVAGEASVAVEGPDGDSERLEEGDGYVADGLLTVRAREDGTVILAAVIGEEIASGGSGGNARQTPTVEEAVGAIEFYVQTCAPGITVETISDEACPSTPPEEESLQLLTFEGTDQAGGRTLADAEIGQTGYVWTGLELRTHVLQVFASAPESIYIEETDQVTFIPGPQWEITLTEEEPYALVPIYRLTEEIPEEDVSTVTVTFLGCEAGQEPEFFLPENCYDPIGGSAALVVESTGGYLGPDQAVVNEDLSLTWTALGYDLFTVVDVALPDGYDTYEISEQAVATDDGAPDAFVYVYAFLPLEE